MKKLLLLFSVVLLVAFAAAPLAAADGEKIKQKDVFHVPAEVPDDLGELNHGCAGGLYTLIEGTYVRKITTVYSPSQEAWDAGDPNATLSITGTGSYKGVWDNSENDRMYELRAHGPIRYSYTEDTAGNFIFGFDWTGSYVDIETGEVADWWDWDWYSDEVTAWGVRDGTCGSLGE